MLQFCCLADTQQIRKHTRMTDCLLILKTVYKWKTTTTPVEVSYLVGLDNGIFSKRRQENKCLACDYEQKIKTVHSTNSHTRFITFKK